MSQPQPKHAHYLNGWTDLLKGLGPDEVDEYRPRVEAAQAKIDAVKALAAELHGRLQALVHRDRTMSDEAAEFALEQALGGLGGAAIEQQLYVSTFYEALHLLSIPDNVDID